MWFAPPSFFHLWSRVSEEEWAGDAIATAACQCRTGQGQRAMPAGGRFGGRLRRIASRQREIKSVYSRHFIPDAAPGQPLLSRGPG